MLSLIPREIFQIAGVGVFLLLGLVVVEIVKLWIGGLWIKTKGNRRRKNDDDWTRLLIETLANNGNELRNMSVDISEIKGLLRNGLRSDLSEVKRIIEKCHDLNAMKEFEAKQRSEQ